MKIGLMDSGMGGLSVLHEAFHLLPNEEYLFYADVDHVPYGLKKPEEIISYTTDIVEFLISKGAEVVIIACNTATSVAIEKVRKLYDIPIIGMEPAVKPAVHNSHNKRVMVMATPVTIRENKLKTLIDKVDTEHLCDLLPMPHLVEFAENEMYESHEAYDYVIKELKPYDLSVYSELVLGCTHFNYFKPIYRNLFGDEIEIIDGNNGTIRHLAGKCGLTIENTDKKLKYKEPTEVLTHPKVTYYASGRLITDEKMLTHIMRMHNRLEEVRHI